MNDSLKDYKDIDSMDLDNEVTVEPCNGGLEIIPQNMGTFSGFGIGVNQKYYLNLNINKTI